MRSVFIVLGTLVLTCLASTAVFADEEIETALAADQPMQPVATEAVPPPQPVARYLESGIASTYGTGDGFQGNRTACGQIFDTHIPQVAHKTLPCGTRVRVEDSGSGESVVVEVTDRGPYIRGRVVDLSWAAFRQLDPSGPGLLTVNVYVLAEP